MSRRRALDRCSSWRRLIAPTAALAILLTLTTTPRGWCDKNPAGDFFGPGGMPPATQGSGATVGPAELPPTPPPGWNATSALPINPNVRHDLTLNNWTITDVKTGQVVGRWEWDTGRQNFIGSYTNGARDVLRFEEWNDRGRIGLSGYNNFGLRVHFTGTQYDTYVEGTATADTQPTPFVWQWRADTGGVSRGTAPSVGRAPSPAENAKSSASDDLSNFWNRGAAKEEHDGPSHASQDDEISWHTDFNVASGLAFMGAQPLVIYFNGPKGIADLEGGDSFRAIQDRASLVLLVNDVASHSAEKLADIERQFDVHTYPTFVVAKVKPNATNELSQYDILMRCSGLPAGECPKRVARFVLDGGK